MDFSVLVIQGRFLEARFSTGIFRLMSLSRTDSPTVSAASASACGDLAHTSTDAPTNSEKKAERQAQQADYSGTDENDEKYCVGFDANDPENPQVP
jgi:hypothetical protein